MKTKTPLALASTALISLALGGCASNGMTSAGADAGMEGAGASASTSAHGAAGDHAMMPPPAATTLAEALALVTLVDQHEAKMAKQAKSKNVTGPAMEYANMMETHHTAHMAQTKAMLASAGGMPSNSPGVKMLMAMDKKVHAQLGALSGDAYARAYMQHMVMSHQQGIAMVDASMGVATDAAARDFMTATRQSMQMHLDQAMAIQSQLGG